MICDGLIWLTNAVSTLTQSVLYHYPGDVISCNFFYLLFISIYIYMIKCCVWKSTIFKCTYWKMVPCQPENSSVDRTPCNTTTSTEMARCPWKNLRQGALVEKLKFWSRHLVIWLFSRRIHATYIIIIIIIIINQKLSKYTHVMDPFASGICVTCSFRSELQAFALGFVGTCFWQSCKW